MSHGKFQVGKIWSPEWIHKCRVVEFAINRLDVTEGVDRMRRERLQRLAIFGPFLRGKGDDPQKEIPDETHVLRCVTELLVFLRSKDFTQADRHSVDVSEAVGVETVVWRSRRGRGVVDERETEIFHELFHTIIRKRAALIP